MTTAAQPDLALHGPPRSGGASTGVYFYHASTQPWCHLDACPIQVVEICGTAITYYIETYITYNIYRFIYIKP